MESFCFEFPFSSFLGTVPDATVPVPPLSELKELAQNAVVGLTTVIEVDTVPGVTVVGLTALGSAILPVMALSGCRILTVLTLASEKL